MLQHNLRGVGPSDIGFEDFFKGIGLSEAEARAAVNTVTGQFGSYAKIRSDGVFRNLAGWSGNKSEYALTLDLHPSGSVSIWGLSESDFASLSDPDINWPFLSLSDGFQVISHLSSGFPLTHQFFWV